MAPTTPASDPVDPAARLSYRGQGIEGLDPSATPLEVLRAWYAEAVADERVKEANAMIVATADADALPDARTVLLKGLDSRGFVFYTNTGSSKGVQLQANPKAALVLPWHPMYRQVRARGEVEQVSREESEAYFQSRPRGSQVAAWASRQSGPLDTRAELERAVAAVEARFADDEMLPLPPFWGGYRVLPVEIELWVGQESRLHDRWVWTATSGAPARLDSADGWSTSRRHP